MAMTDDEYGRFGHLRISGLHNREIANYEDWSLRNGAMEEQRSKLEFIWDPGLQS